MNKMPCNCVNSREEAGANATDWEDTEHANEEDEHDNPPSTIENGPSGGQSWWGQSSSDLPLT